MGNFLGEASRGGPLRGPLARPPDKEYKSIWTLSFPLLPFGRKHRLPASRCEKLQKYCANGSRSKKKETTSIVLLPETA